MRGDSVRERFLTIMSTKYYTQFSPEEIIELYNDLNIYLKKGDSKLTESQYLSLVEMFFYLTVFLSKDVDAEVVFNTIKDRLGENSPRLHVMKATLLQINDGDDKASEYLEKLLNDEYEYSADLTSYLIVAKKLLSIKCSNKQNDKHKLIKELLELSEKFPLDPEIWWYAGLQYYEMGELDQAKYCFEEVILIMPFNYVAFSQIAQILYQKSLQKDTEQKESSILLKLALDNALRAVELSELYLKGWSYVAVITQKLGDKKELHNLATKKIKEISANSNPTDKAIAQHILKEQIL